MGDEEQDELDVDVTMAGLQRMLDSGSLGDGQSRVVRDAIQVIEALQPTSHPQVEEEDDGRVRVDLMHPPKLPNGEPLMESIRLRRPTFGDIAKIVGKEARAPKTVAQLVVDTFTTLSTLKRDQVESLDGRDFRACQAAYLIAMGND